MEKYTITKNILDKLEHKSFSARSLSKELELDKKTINRHLYAMETLGVVSKKDESPPTFYLLNKLENEPVKETIKNL